MKRYIIKDIKLELYYGGFNYGWCNMINMAETFNTKEEAEIVVINEGNGWYKIEEIYIVC